VSTPLGVEKLADGSIPGTPATLEFVLFVSTPLGVEKLADGSIPGTPATLEFVLFVLFVLFCAPVAGMNDKNMIVIKIGERLINFTGVRYAEQECMPVFCTIEFLMTEGSLSKPTGT